VLRVQIPSGVPSPIIKSMIYCNPHDINTYGGCI